MYEKEIKEIDTQISNLENRICTNCGAGLVKATNLIQEESKWFYLCDNHLCNTVANLDFFSTDYQLEFLADNNQLMGYYGGYGAGKTASAAMRFFLHVLTVTRGESLYGAAG